MGFIKDAVGIAGIGVGVYAGGLIGIAASITGSDSLEKLSQKVFDTSSEVGDRLGDIAEDVVDTSVNATRNAISSYSANQNMIGQQDNHKIEKALDAFYD